MKYLSLDIETTGLDPACNQILEVAAVVENYRYGKKNKPVEKLPAFHCYVKPEHDLIHGSSYALSMHSRIFKILAKPETADAPVYNISEMYVALNKFIKKYFGDETVTLAGKNVISFDVSFMREVFKANYSTLRVITRKHSSAIFDRPFESVFRFRHRAIDPGSMYMLPEDSAPPDMVTCLKRAGIVPTALHTALGDARVIIRLVRYFFLLQSGKE